jgi:hypothetical protein
MTVHPEPGDVHHWGFGHLIEVAIKVGCWIANQEFT